MAELSCPTHEQVRAAFLVSYFCYAREEQPSHSYRLFKSGGSATQLLHNWTLHHPTKDEWYPPMSSQAQNEKLGILCRLKRP